MSGRPTRYRTRELLSPRQREVIALLARGKSNAEIAAELGIGFESVKTHVSEILGKLGVDSREEAVAAWREQRSPSATLRRWSGALLPALSGRGLAAAGLAAIAVVVTVTVLTFIAMGGGDGDTMPAISASPTTEPAPSATVVPTVQTTTAPAGQTALSTSTVATTPGCVRYSDLPGMPVGLGYNVAAGTACVSWRPALGDGLRVDIVPTGDLGLPAAPFMFGAGAARDIQNPPDYPEILARQYVDLPAGYLPPRSSTNQSCLERDASFQVVVTAADGTIAGGEAWYSRCNPTSLTASGCGNMLLAVNGAVFSSAAFLDGRPTCIAWLDDYSGESGFEIHLSYSPSGQEFTFFAPPDTVEYVLPPEAQHTPPGPGVTEWPRKDPIWEVFVILADGTKERIGGGAMIVG